MAELNNNTGSASTRRTMLKSLPKVDLTAMVDLAFLLITFFMLTTSLSEPSEMNIFMPVDTDEPGQVPDDRTMTVCLGTNNQMLWYMGTVNNPKNLNVTNTSGIRNVFLAQMESVKKITGKPLIVLVKPGEKSKFIDLVDILDELAIVKVQVYAIVDITSQDKEMLIKRTASF